MPASAADFIGLIPKYYDQYLRTLLFDEYAADLARRVCAGRAGAVLETAAGTSIASRHLRDALPAETRLVVTDLNEPMLDIARAKFQPGENVEFRATNALRSHPGNRCAGPSITTGGTNLRSTALIIPANPLVVLSRRANSTAEFTTPCAALP